MRIFPLLFIAFLMLASPVMASERIYNPDERIEFALTEADGFQDILVRAARPGLLALETDPETAKKVTVEVLDMQGQVVGRGGARIQRSGEYLVRLRRRGDFANWDGKGEGVFALWSPDPDTFEPNDSPDAGSVLVLDDDHPVAGGAASLFPSDDADHFTLRLARPGLVTSLISIPAIVEPGIRFWLELSTDGKEWRSGEWRPGEWRLGEWRSEEWRSEEWRSGEWRSGETRLVPEGDLHLVLRSSAPQPVPVELGFEFVPNWDTCEPNNRLENACDLSDGKTVSVSLFPAGDVDWFSVSVDRPGAIALSLTGLPPTEYDQNKKVIRGLDLRVDFGQTPAGRGGQSYITHGTVFIGTPSAGEYRFALSGHWIDTNPVRAMGIKASFVDPTAGSPDPKFSILGVYGGSSDDNSAFELTVLAGLGSGRFYNAANSRDVEMAVRHFIGLPPASEASEEPADSVDETAEAPSKQEAAEPEAQTANLPVISPENRELERLRLLAKRLQDLPEATLWRHSYKDENGAVVKRLEAAEKAEREDRWKLLESEKLTPRVARRLLSRAIQRLE